MTAPIVVLDLETCGLDIADPIWEVAAIRRDPDGTETEYHTFVQHDVTKAAKLPDEFRADHDARYDPATAVPVMEMLWGLLDLFGIPEDYRQRAHVVGAVPNFDTERIGCLFRAHQTDVPWHHHLIDVETLAVGYLMGQDEILAGIGGDDAPDAPFPGPPWDSDDLSRAVGVDPDEFARHTAMGDCRWALALYDTVMGSPR